MLEGDKVMWNVDGKPEREPYDPKNAELFYGLSDVGKNFVWKRLDSDPTLFLNYYHKVKGFLKPLHVLTRY